MPKLKKRYSAIQYDAILKPLKRLAVFILPIATPLIIRNIPIGKKKKRAKIITGHEYQKFTFLLWFIFLSSNLYPCNFNNCHVSHLLL